MKQHQDVHVCVPLKAELQILRQLGHISRNQSTEHAAIRETCANGKGKGAEADSQRTFVLDTNTE